jgi:hypothetical protein
MEMEILNLKQEINKLTIELNQCKALLIKHKITFKSSLSLQ